MRRVDRILNAGRKTNHIYEANVCDLILILIISAFDEDGFKKLIKAMISRTNVKRLTASAKLKSQTLIIHFNLYRSRTHSLIGTDAF